MRFPTSAVMALVVVASAACDTVDAGGIAPTQRDATITMPGNNFLPDAVTIPVGGRVLWVGSGVEHNVLIYGDGAPGGCARWSVGDCLRAFPTAGFFGYLCSLHANMAGVIKVE